MDQPHDSSYHLLFSEPHLLEDLLRHFVDEPWVPQLDFARMERINAKLHSEGLERREGDIIVRISFLTGPDEIYLLLLLEFQSTVDHWMAVRFVTYVGLLYQQLIKEQRLIDGKLPPVFPLLLYNGDNQWRAATELKALIALPANSPLHAYQPEMRYYLVDESQYPQGKPGSLSGLLFKIENANNPTEIIAAVNEMIAALPTHLDSLKRAFTVWIKYVVAHYKDLDLNAPDLNSLEETKAMLLTRLEKWEQGVRQQCLLQGEARGFERGETYGFERGRFEGIEQKRQRDIQLLQKILSRKFGELSADQLQTITQVSPEQLEIWLENAPFADNVQQALS